MAVDNREQYLAARESLDELAADGTISREDAALIQELCSAFDEGDVTVEKPRWPDAPDHLRKTRSYSTLENWTHYLRDYAKRVELADTTASELNRVAQSWHDGTDPEKDLAKSTIRNYQNAARVFYRYHDDLGIDWSDISTFSMQETSIDPRDMLSDEEVEAVRNAPDNTRDRAIVHLLLYTGMRNTALRTLRVKDVNLSDATFKFNTDADGLKHVDRPHAPRPLLGAKNAVREWLKDHPAPDNDDAYLITSHPRYAQTNPEETVGPLTIQRACRKAKEEAGIEKPLHPHALRHNFVTMCKRDYGMDDADVKFLIGHEPGSDVMETTYAHLSAEDHVQSAREAAGVQEPDDDSPMTPDFCPTCDEPLPTDARACSRCGTVLTPDAHEAKQTIDEAVYEAKGAAETDDEEAAVDAIKRLIDENPELAAELADELS
ncbi:MAG: tyrosine-type recombinase/integrase [Haloarculaceae archaeon]